jgi:hypothetical protein
VRRPAAVRIPHHVGRAHHARVAERVVARVQPHAAGATVELAVARVSAHAAELVRPRVGVVHASLPLVGRRASSEVDCTATMRLGGRTD